MAQGGFWTTSEKYILILKISDMTIEEITGHLGKFRVGIAGAGGLGSNCAAALVRSGIGSLVIADFDIIDKSNLNRQFYFAGQVGMKKVEALKINLGLIGSSTIIEVVDARLTRDNIPGIFADCDLIIEAFDQAEMKEMLAETVLSLWPGKAFIMGSGMAGYGHTDTIKTRDLGDNLFVCGDEQTEISDHQPPMAPRVGIVANMQANLAIDIIMKIKRDDNYSE